MMAQEKRAAGLLPDMTVPRMGRGGGRARIAAPPFSPPHGRGDVAALVRAVPDGVLPVVAGLALVATAALAALPGAPAFAAVASAAVGLGALVLHGAALRRLKEEAKAREERGRTLVERLSDRMWELQESEERARGLTDALGDIVVQRDREGRIVHANRVLGQLLGMAPSALRGRRLGDLGIEVGVVPDSAFHDGECLSSTDVALRTGGTERWFSWIELSVRDKESGVVSHRAIARDITARKQAEAALIAARERAEAASEAKSRFLATVSHEIRTPMNGIMGMARLLVDTKLTPEQRTYVGAVSTSAAALLALIEDLLDYSKIEFGRLDLEPQPVNPRELVENVVELIAPRAHDKGIGIGSCIAPDVPALMNADPGRLRQVLVNILGNAVKFTETGGVSVDVAVAGEGAARRLRFAIADTGPGLRRDDIARLFEEFEQGDGDAARGHGGAGLGLAISRRIVEAMGGTIAAGGEPGRGACFTVEIPVVDAVAPRIDLAGALGGRRVAVAAASAMEAGALARTVELHGGEAAIVGSPQDVAAFASGGLDALLVDAALETGGGDFLARLREGAPATARTITLIAPGERARLAAFGARFHGGFLVRPVRVASLLRILLSVPAAPALADDGAADPAAGIGRGLRVLVAEDNDVNALLARSALARAGHEVDVVPNGKAAVEALTDAGGAHRYDVVLMDLHMPVMDGLTAIAAIRRHEERHARAPVPILVLSADSQETTRHGVVAHGATGFLTKPVDPRAMIEAVESHAAG
jgi:PAS domain S-box-containing protein